MARFYRYSGVQKTIAAGVASTVTFPANEIEGSGVIAYNIHLQGAGNDLVDVDEVRVFSSGDIILQASPAQLRTFIEGTHKTGSVQATSETTLHVPLYLPDAVDRDSRDSCQFPAGAQPQVEIDFLATAAAGTCMISWTVTDVPPAYVSRFYKTITNVPASATAARIALQDGGIIKGFVLNTVGVAQARLVLSGRETMRLPGPQFAALTFGNALLQTRMGEQPYTITDPFFIPVSAGLQAAVGSSYIELDTGAAWAGAANELCVWSVVPLGGPEGE